MCTQFYLVTSGPLYSETKFYYTILIPTSNPLRATRDIEETGFFTCFNSVAPVPESGSE